MTLYRYRAVGRDGGSLEGTIEAIDRRAAIAQVQAMGHFAISAEPAGRGGLAALLPDLNVELTNSHGQDRDDALQMLRGLADLTGAGLTLDVALLVLRGTVTSIRARDAVENMRDKVRSGDSLADAMAPHTRFFSEYVVGAVRAAERGGFLPEALSRLADAEERIATMRTHVRSSMTYPVILIAMSGLSVILILTVVIPNLAPLFASAPSELGWPARMLVGVSGFVTTNGGVLILALAAALIALRAALRAQFYRRMADRLLLNISPLRNLIVGVQLGGCLRILSMLVSNGVPVPEAISLSSDTLRNGLLRDAMARISDEVKEGRRISTSLSDCAHIPETVTHLVRVGEETGHLAAMMAEASDLLSKDVDRRVQRISVALVPSITLALGVLVAALIAIILDVLLTVNEIAL